MGWKSGDILGCRGRIDCVADCCVEESRYLSHVEPNLKHLSVKIQLQSQPDMGLDKPRTRWLGLIAFDSSNPRDRVRNVAAVPCRILHRTALTCM
jgi:hypothetical protein